MEAAQASTGTARSAAPRVVIDRKLRLRVAGLVAGKRRRANGANNARSKRRVTAAASYDDRGSADDAMQRIEALLSASERSASDKRVASQTLSGLLAQTQSALRDRVRPGSTESLERSPFSPRPRRPTHHAQCMRFSREYPSLTPRAPLPPARFQGPGPGEAAPAHLLYPQQDRGERQFPEVETWWLRGGSVFPTARVSRILRIFLVGRRNASSASAIGSVGREADHVRRAAFPPERERTIRAQPLLGINDRSRLFATRRHRRSQEGDRSRTVKDAVSAYEEMRKRAQLDFAARVADSQQVSRENIGAISGATWIAQTQVALKKRPTTRAMLCTDLCAHFGH